MVFPRVSMSNLQNLNVQSIEIAEKSRFGSIQTVSSLFEKMTFSEKVEQRAAIKFCVHIGKTPKETHEFGKQSGKHCNMGRSLWFFAI